MKGKGARWSGNNKLRENTIDIFFQIERIALELQTQEREKSSK